MPSTSDTEYGLLCSKELVADLTQKPGMYFRGLSEIEAKKLTGTKIGDDR